MRYWGKQGGEYYDFLEQWAGNHKYLSIKYQTNSKV